MRIFWNAEEKRLRTFWRLLLQTALMVALAVVPILLVAEPLTALHRHGRFLAGLSPDNYDRVVNMIVGPLLAAAVVGSVALAGRWFDHRPWEQFRAQFDAAGWRGLGLGVCVSAVLIGLVFAVERAAGWLNVSGTMVMNTAGVSLGLGLSYSLVKVLCVGIYEEFLSRGYHLRNMTAGLGLTGGLVGSSAIFSLLHLTNENASVLSTLSLFVTALYFASAVLATGRLATAIGAHIGWNLCEGAVMGFPVSGDKEPISLIGHQDSGPALWTGGLYGPEGGLLGIVASMVGIGLMTAIALRRQRTKLASPKARIM
jgi:uncharacterized protein